MADPTRTALSQPEPAGPTDEAWLEFIEQLRRVQDVAQCEGLGPRFDLVEFAMQAWRGRPEPPAPAGEVAELAVFLRGCADDHYGHGRRQFTRAADLLERLSPPQPLPVSERLLPGPEDCDSEGRCWCFTPRLGFEGQLIFHSRWILSVPTDVDTHWLPARALPLPGEVE